MWNIAQMLPKVRKSAKGCSKCKIVLQTQESAQKVLSAIGKGLVAKHLNKKNAGKPRVLAINALLHSLVALAATFSTMAFYC